MQRSGNRRRGMFLLAGAVVVAGGAALFADDDRAPTAEITGDPLVAEATPSRATSEQIATFEALADREPTEKAAVPSTSASSPLATLIDFDNITRVGDVYEAPLSDGRKATLTLDPDLQPLAEKLLAQARAPRGAIVVMTPDGRILALAGRRTEDPKGSRDGTPDWRLATDVWAPAASIFKLVTASALYGAGVDADTKVCYHGGVRSVMESNLTDSKRDNRCESLAYGVAHSNNAILGKLAFQKLAPDALDTTAKTFGFTQEAMARTNGTQLGIELPLSFGTAAVPTTRDLAYAKTAAGFQNTQLSVAGGALLSATIANGGEQPTPRLIAAIDGVPVTTTARANRVLSAATAKDVARMMVGTCNAGSAAKAFSHNASPWKVAGKTGTLTRTKPFYMEHSWFVGFAPSDQPQLVVSVLFGNPENWHLRGHEAARRLIDRALKPRPSRGAKS